MGICTTPSISYSTGSSVVISLSSIEFNSFNAPYSVVVFPQPVGPVTSTMPLGLRITSRNSSENPRGHAHRVQIQHHHRSIQDPHHHALAEHRGQHAHAQIDRMPAHGQANSPVLRHAPLGNVQIGHHLDARGNGKRQVTRRRHHLVQYPVRPNANLELVLEGLEMQVAGVIPNRQQQHHVQ